MKIDDTLKNDAFSPQKKSRNPDEISFAPSEAVKVSKITTVPTKTLNLFASNSNNNTSMILQGQAL